MDLRPNEPGPKRAKLHTRESERGRGDPEGETQGFPLTNMELAGQLSNLSESLEELLAPREVEVGRG
jgi:hypothetical protein